MAIPKQRMTLEEFLELPERKPALEYEDGVVVQKVSPQGKHSRLQYSITNQFNRVTESKKLAIAFPELRATFAGRSRVPDVAVYRWERIPHDAAGEIANVFYDPPDISIEIVSPGQSGNYLVRRCLWYVGNGVKAALLVDPKDKSVLLFRPDRIPASLHGTDHVELDDILPGFSLTVQEIFDALIL